MLKLSGHFYIGGIMDFNLETLESILALVGAAVTFATAVVKFTPTTKDDAILEKVVKVFEFFSIVNRKKV